MPKLRWVLLTSIALFVVAITMTSFVLEWRKIDVLSGVLDDRMLELAEERRRNQALKEKIDYYRTPAGVARLAREDFNLVLPGEEIYRIEIVSGEVQAVRQDPTQGTKKP